MTVGVGENRQTYLELPGRPESDIPPFTKFFAEDSPGFFAHLLSENEIIPRQRPLANHVDWVSALREYERKLGIRTPIANAEVVLAGSEEANGQEPANPTSAMEG